MSGARHPLELLQNTLKYLNILTAVKRFTEDSSNGFNHLTE